MLFYVTFALNKTFSRKNCFLFQNNVILRSSRNISLDLESNRCVVLAGAFDSHGFEHYFQYHANSLSAHSTELSIYLSFCF